MGNESDNSEKQVNNIFSGALSEAREILERDNFIKEMLNILPDDLIPGFITDQLEAIEKTLRPLEITLSRLDPIKDAIGLKAINICKEKLLAQKSLLIKKQQELS